MQERQQNRALYFRELATTSERYFLPYVAHFKPLAPGMHVLEIGCGDGGNLLPFARRGCVVTGVDMAATRIGRCNAVFLPRPELRARSSLQIFFLLKDLEASFDIIICHDVLEHIGDKRTFLLNLRRYVKPGGVVFMSFPAWQMPFGGHQQTLRNRWTSRLPFIHLLPNFLYSAIMRAEGPTGDASTVCSTSSARAAPSNVSSGWHARRACTLPTAGSISSIRTMRRSSAFVRAGFPLLSALSPTCVISSPLPAFT